MAVLVPRAGGAGKSGSPLPGGWAGGARLHFLPRGLCMAMAPPLMPMQHVASDPLEQERIFTRFLAKSEATRRRKVQWQRARLGAPWTWVVFAALVWVPTAGAMVLDLGGRAWAICLWSVPVTMALWTLVMAWARARCREELYLSIIEEEAPAAYRRLQDEKIIR